MRGRMEDGFLEVKKHSFKKYRMLEKYVDACVHFQRKHRNFTYIDTHGGSGKVIFNDRFKDGSIQIAARIAHDFLCYVMEIDSDRYKCLKEAVKDFSNVIPIPGDCNKKIDNILSKIPDWKFAFCFIDPDALMYERNGVCCHQLSWETVEKIAQRKTELFLNFPLHQMKRLIGHYLKTSGSTTYEYEGALTDFFGTEKWKEAGLDRRKLLELYISERLEVHYKYIGATLVKSRNVPLYYLIFASKHPVGAKIMRDIMRKEWGQLTLAEFDEVFPLERFIFE